MRERFRGDLVHPYGSLLAVLAVFVGCFFAIDDHVHRQMLLYALLLIGLASSMRFKSAIIVTNALGIGLLFGASGPVWTGPAVLLTVLFCGLSAVPYYFARKCAQATQTSSRRAHARGERINELTLAVAEYASHRRALEQEIEKINQLYVLGRELVEHTELSEVVEHLGRLLLGRPGIGTVTVFLWEQQAWQCVYCSPAEGRTAWESYMRDQSSLAQERRFRILTPPPWLTDKSVVFWPVRLDRYPLASIVMTTDVDMAPRFLEEGAIFIPQIALGLKRTRLFMEVKERSRNDGLTGLFVRRYFHERLMAEILRSKRYDAPFAVCMLDIDFFKRINDTYGHVVGDKVLCSLARIFVDCSRPGDLVGRYGGEEFVILMPAATAHDARTVAEEICRMVARKLFHEEGQSFRVTVSIGIGCYPADATSADALIAAADKALYWVKQNGRNAVQEFARLT